MALKTSRLFAAIRWPTPKHIEGDRLRKFDVILANPPYSIKQWDREAWSQDKWGRNFLGTPPQGRADYAFQQHILASLSDKGRCAILWPHGVLFRNEEQTMRAKMVELDWVEAVIGLGPNLFYNSPMESCIVVCNRQKPVARKGKVLFIDAVNDVARDRAQSFLAIKHQERIGRCFLAFSAEEGFSALVTLEKIIANGANLSIPMYVQPLQIFPKENGTDQPATFDAAFDQWRTGSRAFWQQMDAVLETLDGLGVEVTERG